MEGDQTITLSLISHTNVGKTTLTRTLLRKDVGQVLDQAHVTVVSEAYTMIEDGGARLQLWDTPGFGDTARLLERLRQADQPLGWLLRQVWDRHLNKPLWCSQQAVRNVKEEADIVLYLINVSESPIQASFVGMELEILTWIGRPVVLLLNQTGPPRGREADEKDASSWRQYTQKYPIVRAMVSMDAFARCWIQEEKLLEVISPLLPPVEQPLFERLRRAWRARSTRVFRESMIAIARQLARTVRDREAIEKEGFRGRVSSTWDFVASGGKKFSPDKEQAMRRLAERLDELNRASLNTLIELHGLKGQAAQAILNRLERGVSGQARLHEGVAALIGGLLSGAIAGVVTDIMAGGMSFGGGALLGGVAGAAGAAVLAKGYNIVSGGDQPVVRWSEEFFLEFVKTSVLRYLAVAHFGRGRGDWAESEYPPFWQEEVAASIKNQAEPLRRLWRRAQNSSEEASQREIEPLVTLCTKEILKRLWPDAASLLPE